MTHIVQSQPPAGLIRPTLVEHRPHWTRVLRDWLVRPLPGVALCAASRAGLDVGEYAPSIVKKAVVGTGGADKAQVHAMVSRLLPGARIAGADAADALAVAICHGHHLATARRTG